MCALTEAVGPGQFPFQKDRVGASFRDATGSLFLSPSSNAAAAAIVCIRSAREKQTTTRFNDRLGFGFGSHRLRFVGELRKEGYARCVCACTFHLPGEGRHNLVAAVGREGSDNRAGIRCRPAVKCGPLPRCDAAFPSASQGTLYGRGDSGALTATLPTRRPLHG
ncbi:hypothetical protein HPB50_007125 [Hyalomma asiaticum]|uniref:Uncharacterized protein n=1 Tax=Hyalomma asiaticum TaxID=266040 RepID=A0ACB7T123_HYAAI|nr:hypothetical protein HPB50_007125 [Hyalomma asiaticum]